MRYRDGAEVFAVAQLSAYQAAFCKCLTALICFEYRATDVEPYNEVALCVPLAGFGAHLLPDWLFSFLDLSLRTLHAHIIHLPVNTDLALRGGLDFFGYPKFLAGIHFEDKQKKHSCELRDADDNFLTLRIVGALHSDRRQ